MNPTSKRPEETFGSVLRFKYRGPVSRPACFFQSLQTLWEGKPTRRAGELVFPKFSVLRFKYAGLVSRSTRNFQSLETLRQEKPTG